jgi:hypothetical protein
MKIFGKINNMQLFGKIILLIVCIGIYILVHNAHKNEIKDWAKENNYTIEKIDNSLFDYGPFNYCGKGQEIFSVNVVTAEGKHKTFYFRTGNLFPADIEEYNK